MTFDELSESVYEDLNGHIVTVSTDGAMHRVIFECDDWRDHVRRRQFELVFEDVPEAATTPSACGHFHVTDEHPLLWQHNDESVSMFFSSAPAEPHELLGRLFEAHRMLFDGWRELSDYWQADSESLRAGHGRSAAGPRRAIDAYARVVGDSMRYSIVHSHSPFGDYRVVLFDECYVVCRSVSVIEHELAD
jgi:hypothetical protein